MYNNYTGYGSQSSNFNSFLGGMGNGGGVAIAVIALILAIAATVVAAIMIMPQNKAKSLNKFWYFVHKVINFKDLLIEKIMKILYIFFTVYVILLGLFSLFTGAISGLLLMILGPIFIRLTFELFMMFIILVNNTVEIRKHLTDKKTDGCEQSEKTTHDYKFCTTCGTRYDAAAGTCPNGCEKKQQETPENIKENEE